MKKYENFRDDLDRRRYSIVLILTTVFFGLSVLSVLVSLWGIRSAEGIIDFIATSINILVVLLFGYLRFRLLKKNFKLTLNILVGGLALIGLAVIYLSGTTNWISYLLFAINLLLASIVLNKKAADLILGFQILGILIIWLLQTTATITYLPSPSGHSLPSTLVGISILLIFWRISRIGYSEIENSYKEAQSYAYQLEEINQDLDKVVKKRTQQLKDSINAEMESLYASAVFGRITNSIVHDLGTPLSALKGVVELLEKDDSPDRDELLQIGKSSVQQLVKITENGQKLLSNKETKEEIHPLPLITNLLAITKYQLNSADVRTKVDLNPDVILTGVAGVFERVFLNLLTNSLEELVFLEKDRKLITINDKIEDDKYIIEFKDTGRGVDPKIVNHIFEPGMTNKNTDNNRGVGLFFVKNSIETYFDGQISLTSKPGEFTLFTIEFPNYEIAQAKSTNKTE